MGKLEMMKDYREWYKKNRKQVNARRRERYRTDPSHRAAECKRVQAYKKANPSSGFMLTRDMGDTIEVEVFRIGPAAEGACTTPEQLRKYETQGLIPECSWPEEAQRLYTENQIQLMKRLVLHRKKTRAPAKSPAVKKIVSHIYTHWNDK